MNNITSKDSRGLKHYEYAGGYISYDPSILTEHYEVKDLEGNSKQKSDKW